MAWEHPLLHVHLFRPNARQKIWPDQAIRAGRQTYGLISNLLAQRRDVLWLERRLNQLRELLYCPLQVPAARNKASASAFPNIQVSHTGPPIARASGTTLGRAREGRGCGVWGTGTEIGMTASQTYRRTDVPLIILKQLLLVVLLQIICHRVRPLEGHAALEHLVYGLLHELHLDPRELARDLHLLHLLLRLGVELDGELGGLLVVGPAVVVLRVMYSQYVFKESHVL